MKLLSEFRILDLVLASSFTLREVKITSLCVNSRVRDMCPHVVQTLSTYNVIASHLLHA